MKLALCLAVVLVVIVTVNSLRCSDDSDCQEVCLKHHKAVCTFKGLCACHFRPKRELPTGSACAQVHGDCVPQKDCGKMPHADDLCDAGEVCCFWE